MSARDFLVSAISILSSHNVQLSARYWRSISSTTTTTTTTTIAPRADGIVTSQMTGDHINPGCENTNNNEKPIVLFVHQYAVMGGSSVLMHGMAREATRLGYDAITFDLRGAGRSTGSSSWTNASELDDVKAVIDYILNEYPHREIFLVGSSGGASLAGAALDHHPSVLGGMLIGYVWGFWASFLFGWSYKYIEQSSKPKFFIIGGRDEFTSLSTYQKKLANLYGQINEHKVIEGENHFEIEGPQYDRQMMEWLHQFISEKIILRKTSIST